MEKLAEENQVKLIWVPGHQDITGNEEADKLAKNGAPNPLSGPEPGCPIAYTMVKKSLAQWIDVNQKKRWEKTRGCNHSKKLLKKPLQKQTREILRMCRKEARNITAFLTGHGNFRGHLHKLGTEISSMV